MSRIPSALVLSLLVSAAAAQRGGRRGPPPPPLEHGTFEVATFASEALERPLPYGVYLPAEYAAEENAEREYPLVVWLHGMFENHESFHGRGGAAVLDAMVGAGEFPPAVFVTAEGDRNSFYMNGVASGAWEDAITVDLLDHLEKTYRVAKARDRRAIMGVSMGGYGALKIALRHPNLFGVVAAHSAALMPRDPGDLEDRFPWLKRWGGAKGALGKVFGDPIDRERWDQENLLLIAEQLDGKELGGMKVYLDCGTDDRYGFHAPNVELHELLDDAGVAHTWRSVDGGDHGWRSGYNRDALPHSLAFVSAALGAGRGTAGLKGLLGAPGGGEDRRDG